MIAHTGDVYLNGKSMHEVTDLEKVMDLEISRTSWESEFSVYTWYTEQDREKDETVLYANFQGKNPNEENVDISVGNDYMPKIENRIITTDLMGMAFELERKFENLWGAHAGAGPFFNHEFMKV